MDQIAIRRHRRADADAQAMLADQRPRTHVIELVGRLDRQLDPVEAELCHFRYQRRQLRIRQWRSPDPGIHAEAHIVSPRIQESESENSGVRIQESE
jgi:hypothetical protein